MDENYFHSRSHAFILKRGCRFEGDWQQRQTALRRAESRQGDAYSLLIYNGEHFTNYLQLGKESSGQVQAVGASLLGIGLLALAAMFGGRGSENDRRRYS